MDMCVIVMKEFFEGIGFTWFFSFYQVLGIVLSVEDLVFIFTEFGGGV